MFMGIAYYPEHWPRERWPVDARLMREAHIGAARMGEFAWSRFEPREGEFDFGWMDDAIDVLAGEGVKTIMCTPTAAPTAWMIKKHPDILPVDANGLISRRFGRRRSYCCNAPAYQEYTRKIVTAMAEHYGHNPNIIGWQIDNELADVYWVNRARCYCESCREKFAAWLEHKYGSLDALNRTWGTVFWSHEYIAWDEMMLPSRGTAGESSSPSHLLDFYRFHSDSWSSTPSCRLISSASRAGINGSRPTLRRARCARSSTQRTTPCTAQALSGSPASSTGEPSLKASTFQPGAHIWAA